MAPFKLLRSKKKKEERSAQSTSESSVPGPSIQLVTNPDDDDAVDREIDPAAFGIPRRTSRYGFNGPDQVPEGGLISLIPSSESPKRFRSPDREFISSSQGAEDDYDQQQSRYQTHDTDQSTYAVADEAALESSSLRYKKPIEDVPIPDNLNAKPGAQRRTAMATYRSTSYREYEQRIIDDSASGGSRGTTRAGTVDSFRYTPDTSYTENADDQANYSNDSGYYYNQPAAGDTSNNENEFDDDNASEAFSFQSSVRYVTDRRRPYSTAGYQQQQREPQRTESQQQRAVVDTDVYGEAVLDRPETRMTPSALVSEEDISPLGVEVRSDTDSLMNISQINILQINNSQQSKPEKPSQSQQQQQQQQQSESYPDKSLPARSPDRPATSNATAEPPELLQPRPRRVSDIGTLTAMSASAEYVGGEERSRSPRKAGGGEGRPRVRLAAPHDTDARPLSHISIKGGQAGLIHYPAPIPTRIKLPPLLSKKKSQQRLSLDLERTMGIPLSAPHAGSTHGGETGENEEHESEDDSSSQNSSIPATPGVAVMFENPHQKLEEMLDQWSPEMAMQAAAADEKAAQEAAAQEVVEEDFGGGPGRSLLDELAERKAQQKSRQRNLVDGTAYGTLLQVDGVIEKGQEKRRSALNRYGLDGMEYVRNGEDEMPLGVRYSQQQQQLQQQMYDGNETGERRKSDGTRWSQYGRGQAGMIAPWGGGGGGGGGEALSRRASAHSIESMARSGLIVPSTASQRREYEEQHGYAPSVMSRDMSMPNLHQYVAGGASVYSGGAPSVYNGAPSMYNGGAASMYNGGAASMYNGGAPSMYNGGAPSMYNGGAPSMYNGGYGGHHAGTPAAPTMMQQVSQSGVLRDQLHARPTSQRPHSKATLNSEEALMKRLQERQMAIAAVGAVPEPKSKTQPTSRMTQEGYDLAARKQQAQVRQRQQQQQQLLMNRGRGAGEVSEYDAEAARREVVERWRRSVYTG
ncbi:hypothetical protein BZA70DRAFT_288630 [Myxozyma melibiosi]|uniref:Uncharacterized protein n=1 Tax=Myxozyma melibiosi TaxID=54550 RepID=A0ABR1F8U6_9ASCO